MKPVSNLKKAVEPGVPGNFCFKVCGITRLEDIRVALGLGVRYLGVNGWPKSPRYVAPAARVALLGQIPVGARVFVDVESAPEAVAAAIAEGFDFVQIHFDPEHPAARERVVAWVVAAGRSRLWLAPRSAPGGQWPEWVAEFVDTIVFDGYKAGEFGGTGRVADLVRFADLRRKFPCVCWVLAGGLGPDTLSAVLGSGAGIFDLNSGVEDAPGVKSAAKLAAALGSAVIQFDDSVPQPAQKSAIEL
jgi:phosphoribosylanthranilate isomerase